MGIFCCCAKKNEKSSQNKKQEKQTEQTVEPDISDVLDPNRKTIDTQEEISQQIPENLLLPYQKYLGDYLDENIDNTNVFEEKLYNNNEKGKIIYSKRVIIAMINKVFSSSNEEYKELDNKDNIEISIKSDGSFLNEEIEVVRSIFRYPKKEYPPKTTIKMVVNYLIFSKFRQNWDQQMKSYVCLEGNENNISVMHNWTKSPFFLVSERDLVEKRFDFIYNKTYIFFESSVNDDYIPLGDGVVRMNDIMFITQVCEENEFFIFKSISQLDPKINLPTAIINSSLPGKISNYYREAAAAMMKDYKDNKLEYEFEIGI